MKIIYDEQCTPARTICIPVSQSLNLEPALTILQKSDLLIFIHVQQDTTTYSQSGLSPSTITSITSALSDLSSHLLLSLVHKFKNQGYYCKAITMVGDPRMMIEQLVDVINPCFVVMKNGYVTRYVIQHVHVPVFVIP